MSFLVIGVLLPLTLKAVPQ